MIISRIASVSLSNFRVAVLIKKRPHLSRVPLAVAEQIHDGAQIVAVNSIASAQSVSSGMTLSQGYAICPKLQVEQLSKEYEKEEEEKLIKEFLNISPLVEMSSNGLFFLDASGLIRLYGSETELAKRIIARARSLQFESQVGIASNKFVATVASKAAPAGECSIVSDGEEQIFLNGLSIEFLALSTESEERLHDLGLRTIGQMASLHENEIIRRFGQEGISLVRNATGLGAECFIPKALAKSISRIEHLMHPVKSERLVVATVEKMLKEIISSLGSEHTGFSEIGVELYLNNDSKHAIRLSLKECVPSSGKFINQLRLNLQGSRLQADVTDVVLTINSIGAASSTQLEFARITPAASITKSSILSNENSSELEELYVPCVSNGLTPDYEMLKEAAASPDSKSRTMTPWRCAYSLGSLSGMRLLNPPRRVALKCKGGKIKDITLGLCNYSIVSQRGPWIISSKWWGQKLVRKYYEIGTSDCGRYLLYYDEDISSWYLQGIYD